MNLKRPDGVALQESLVEIFYESRADSVTKAPPSPAEIVELMPKAFELAQNYPNPFNPTTTIEIALPEDSPVTLEIFDISGRKVRTLVSGNLPAGRHQIAWNGRSDTGLPVSSGIYLYRLSAGEFVRTRKMMRIG